MADSCFPERQRLLDFLGDLKRTHTCGALRPSDAGKRAVLMGWVNRRRDLGSIVFIDLRDRTGVTQVVVNRELNAAAHDKAGQLRNESKQPPFLPGESVLPNEEMRLKYRYIDLRRDAMQFNIEMRHKVSKAIRDYLC